MNIAKETVLGYSSNFAARSSALRVVQGFSCKVVGFGLKAIDLGCKV